MVELNWETNRKEHLARVALKYYRMLRQGLGWERNKQTQGQREREMGEGEKNCMGGDSGYTARETWLYCETARETVTYHFLRAQHHQTSAAQQLFLDDHNVGYNREYCKCFTQRSNGIEVSQYVSLSILLFSICICLSEILSIRNDTLESALDARPSFSLFSRSVSDSCGPWSANDGIIGLNSQLHHTLCIAQPNSVLKIIE